MNPLNKKHETSRICRVFYTDAERLQLGRELAEEHNYLGQVNADFDRVKSDFKAKISAHDAKIVELANKVSSGYEMKAIPCIWVIDQPKQNRKECRRQDTNEVVEVADMTNADKQVDLPLTEMAEKLNEALPEGVSATVTGVAGDGTVAVEADGDPEPEAKD